MISGSSRAWLATVWPADPSGEGEVVQPGDAKHGVVDAFAFEAAVSEDLPGLHEGEGVLDAGTDLLVGLVVFLFPGREPGLAALAAVRDDESGARVAAVGDRETSCRRRFWRWIPPTPCSRCGSRRAPESVGKEEADESVQSGRTAASPWKSDRGAVSGKPGGREGEESEGRADRSGRMLDRSVVRTEGIAGQLRLHPQRKAKPGFSGRRARKPVICPAP